MEVLKYKVISSNTQYKEYSKILENLILSKFKNKNLTDEIALLTLLIEKWDNDHNTFNELDPVQLLQSLMNSHQLKSKDLVDMLGVSKSYVSEILNYRKGFSKVVIRKLASHFKVSQEAFNRPYVLKALERDNSKNFYFLAKQAQKLNLGY
jgi:HTH-type transcriptional regulator/antitoxin HigA